MNEQAERFIRERLPVRPAPSVPQVRLHLAEPSSGVGRLSEVPPYWAYVWAGGAALARHVLAHPQVVAGRRVLDFGAGGGLVAIAAALAGADRVLAAELDPNGRAAIALNAALNGVHVEAPEDDLTLGQRPAVDLVLAGDVFYGPEVAARSGPFLQRCAAAGIEVLVGDPGRKPLPRARLQPIADYAVADFGDEAGAVPSAVYRFT